jgi:uncharacterized BrkB/YihY/UPF0761 family membrane protein
MEYWSDEVMATTFMLILVLVLMLMLMLIIVFPTTPLLHHSITPVLYAFPRC